MRIHRVPAMANVHSHAFQRDLRGVAERTSDPGDDFWAWRDAMFSAVDRLDPERMKQVARRVYAEMRAAGYGVVGEFHYVHHRPDGRPYGEPNAMAIAVAEAAQEVGLQIVLLPAAYHRGGAGIALVRGQQRFADPTPEAFLARVDGLRAWADGQDGVGVGVAAHSVRAVPADWLAAIAEYSDRHGLVRHIHAHEQPRELDECRAEHGCSPIELLAERGFLGERTTIVHGIHVTPAEIDTLARTRTLVASCPTTEGSLGDGCFPARAYRDAGVRVAIGSDSNVIVDPFEEVRELETLARRAHRTRHALLARAGGAGDLWGEIAANGRASLGVEREATIGIDLDHPRLAGIDPDDVLRALATCAAADVVAALAPPAAEERA
ncbi:formimidoylglutamate deiminase [Conexibacter sp. CPCC 206217]|uniref:formimidoylglutamate deiminase n=1 Tax=Conexibacter sp. CPCC 206217 TaxID=3064574 RepID=UPI00271D6A82|nr:formimidoylglutamate deiminase [Conexibacter sp. CPCC 206217]MDO8209731.1 formimidoylglutamate deiminase [Conexibacter sp. CPCC 206217]